MAHELRVTLTAEILERPSTGIWCERCLLPSAGSVTIAWSSPGLGLSITTYEVCPECQWHRVLT